MTTVLRIGSKGKITIPQDILNALDIAHGDYVQVDVECGQAILKPRKLVDPSQSWYWSAEWQQDEADVDRDVDNEALSPEFNSVQESLKWLKE